ncbi:MAG TPA: carbonic anhydrase [Gammaproteobacteria bacterium]|nr:carbonic anhydrase [Gammaproteobacteria bacterium]
MLKIYATRSSLAILISAIALSTSVRAETKHYIAPYTSTKKSLETATPEMVLQNLMAGNTRFINKEVIHRNLSNQAIVTSLKGQFPSALVLSCMDSRGAPEIILDQGIGDIFTVRLAGNVIDSDQLAGIEYATKIVGSKLIIIMGHTQCGAVSGACQNVKLGNLTQLLDKIQPAVSDIRSQQDGKLDCADSKTVDLIAKKNVLNMMRLVTEGSPIVMDLVANKQVMIVGAMQNINSGKVTFFDGTGKEITAKNQK